MLCAIRVSDFAGTLLIRVAQHMQRYAGDIICKNFCMVGPHHAATDNAKSDCHGIALLNVQMTMMRKKGGISPALPNPRKRRD